MLFAKLNRLFAAFCLGLWLSMTLTSATWAQTQPSPEKLALVKELLQLTNAGEMAQKFTDAMLPQLENSMPLVLSQAAGETLSAENKQKYKEQTQQFMQRFREELPKRVNFAQVLEQLSLPLYDRHFTENELKDLINFYRSPTGQKAVKLLPQVVQELMREAEKIITPPITAIVTELLEELQKEWSATKAGKPNSPVQKKP